MMTEIDSCQHGFGHHGNKFFLAVERMPRAA